VRWRFRTIMLGFEEPWRLLASRQAAMERRALEGGSGFRTRGRREPRLPTYTHGVLSRADLQSVASAPRVL
jgi:hypothetical protein